MHRWMTKAGIPTRGASVCEENLKVVGFAEADIINIESIVLSFLMERNLSHAESLKGCMGKPTMKCGKFCRSYIDVLC